MLPDTDPRSTRSADRDPLSRVAVAATVALAALASATACADDPARVLQSEPARDRATDSWQAMAASFQQFMHPDFLVRLLVGLALSVLCAWIVAWHPRRSTRLDPLSDLEERKAIILLGVVGAVTAELSGSSQTLAFVIFGIGALLRFRTVLNNPKLTGKAIIVVVIGLACGMGSWAMAVFVTLFTWILIFWLDSHVSCRVKVRLPKQVDVRACYRDVQELLLSRRARLKSSVLYETKRQMVFLAHVPSGLDPIEFEEDVRARIPNADEADVSVRVA